MLTLAELAEKAEADEQCESDGNRQSQPLVTGLPKAQKRETGDKRDPQLERDVEAHRLGKQRRGRIDQEAERRRHLIHINAEHGPAHHAVRGPGENGDVRVDQAAPLKGHVRHGGERDQQQQGGPVAADSGMAR